MATNLTKRLMSDLFREDRTPTMFFSGYFKSPPKYKFRGTEIVIDAVRNKEEYAIDVKSFTHGRENKATIFTTKEYTPPAYDEYTPLTEKQLENRLPGATAYETPAYATAMAVWAQEFLTGNKNKILRAIEKQAWDSIITGKITLINGDEIDFKQKAAHQITPPVAWSNAAGVPLDDAQGGGKLVRQNAGKTVRDWIFGENAWKLFINNGQVQKFGDYRRINIMDIQPPVFNTEGATFHGVISAGTYEIRLWAYPQYYDVPLGFGLPSEGTSVPYIPTDKAILLTEMPDWRLYYAGVPQIVNRVDPKLGGLFGNRSIESVAGDFFPYAFLDEASVSAKIGVRSKPVCIPVAIDEAVVFTVS